MKPEIEQILSSDETARLAVQKAEQEAEKMKAVAQEKAQSMFAALDKQIQEVEVEKIAPLVIEARNQAELTRVQAEQYIDKLRKKLTLLKDKIADECIDSLLNRSVR